MCASLSRVAEESFRHRRVHLIACHLFLVFRPLGPGQRPVGKLPGLLKPPEIGECLALVTYQHVLCPRLSSRPGYLLGIPVASFLKNNVKQSAGSRIKLFACASSAVAWASSRRFKWR